MTIKRILYIIGQLGIGGAERQLLYLCQYLNRNEFEPLVVSLSEDVRLKPQFDELGVQVIVIPKVMNPDLTRAFKLARVIKEYHPDLIHAYLFVANTWSRIIGALLNIPTVLSERNSQPNKPFFMNVLDRILSPLGTCLIANSRSGAQRIIQNKEFRADAVHVVHNGIPVDRFIVQSSAQRKLAFLKNFGIPENQQIIGVIGRLAYQKNHKLLFQSFPIVRQRHPDTCILCVGDGPRRAELQQLTIELGIKDRVVFAGNRDDIPECLAIMDVLVLTSRWEGLPNVILEAMASSCPVIATNVGGIPEIVKHGETGLLVEPGDVDALVDAIMDILDRRINVESMTNKALTMVINEFSVENMVRQTEIIYNDVLNSHSDTYRI